MKKKNASLRHITMYAGPEESPGYLLWRVNALWKSSIEKVLKTLDLTHPQFVVLATTGWLTQDGIHTNQITISQTAGLDPNTTSQILRSLEKKKLIERIHSIDERAKSPMLTAKGKEILSQAMPAVEKADAIFFNVLPSKELNSLILLFKELAKI